MSKEIIKKLSEIQTKLEAPKSQKNTFGNYNYRSCEDILAALKPLLEATECTLTLTDEMVNLGNRIYVKATATLLYGEETITVCAFAREAETKKGMDVSQITGATSSYARKYALNGLFCIDDTKDADTQDNREQQKKNVVLAPKRTFPGPQRPNNPDPNPKGKIVYNCSVCGVEIEERVASYSKKHNGAMLCRDCQKKDKEQQIEEEEVK